MKPKENKKVTIKSRQKIVLSSLTKRSLTMHIVVNYLVMMCMFVIIVVSILGFAKLGLIKDIDDGLTVKANEIAKVAPIQRHERSAAVDVYIGKYIVAYYDEYGNYIEELGNAQSLNDESFYYTDKHYDKPYTVKINKIEYRVYQIKMTGTEEYNDYTAKVCIKMKDKINLYYSLMATMTIFTLVGAFVLLLISIGLAFLQVAPYNNAIINSQSFTSNASHEINTPLAVIKTNLQNVLTEPDARISDVSKSIAVSLSEIDRLQKLTKQLLMLSRSDDNRLIVNNEPVNIKELLTEICEPYSLIAESQDKAFTLEIGKEINTAESLDKDLLKQITVALLDNEIKYTRAGCEIKVIAEKSDEKLNLTVTDNGDGVPDKDLEKIFLRFYRSDVSRNSPGTGLGLSIVHAMVKSMGGKITVSNVKPHGFKITITLPLSYVK